RFQVLTDSSLDERLTEMPESFTLNQFLAAMHEDDRRALERTWRTAVAAGTPCRLEYRVRGPNGQVRWLASNGVPVRDPASGAVIEWTGTSNDVTDSREARAALVETRDRFERFMDHLPGQAFIKDLNGAYRYANREWQRFFGLSSFEGATDEKLFGERFREAIGASDRSVAETGRTEQNLREVINPDGSVGHQLVTVFPIPAPGETLLGGITLDMTARERAERDLRASEERFRFIAETTGDALYRLRFADMTYDYMSPAIEKLTGYRPDEIDAMGFKELVLESRVLSAGLTVEDFRAMRESGGATEYQAQYRIRAKDGQERWLEDHAYPWRDETGRPLGSVGLLQDVTARKAAEAELERLTRQLEYDAHHDALTGLPNRLLFEDRLSHALERAARGGERLAVMFMDLDRFKHLNDTLGHEAGDALLKAVAERLKGRLRASDTVSRRGGDEFTILVTGIHDTAGAAHVARDLLAALQDAFTIQGREYFVTASLGIAVYPQDGPDGVTLQRHADVAMYRAKASGRDGFECFTPEMNAAAHERLRLEQDLRRALTRGEIGPHYQAIVDATSGAVVAVEALARWRHPELGLLAPGRFLPVSEESGLIAALDEAMLTAACRQMRAWLDAGSSVERVAVNVSGLQLWRGDLSDTVWRALVDAGLDARHLELELSESFLMRDPKDTIQQLQRLRDLGVSLAIDDFGTGYSSMAYLRQLPFDRLKIDRQFVAELGPQPQSWALPQAMLFLAHSLGMSVVAEGVETPEQTELLRSLGCDLLQGFAFSRPVPAAELAPLIAAGAPTA
ncbi:MAG TPA: EAL domain-containing protein, partial [Deinococcales bacterium]|nr:EAL domain-containing protein [Deinococcales bacterium]